MNIGNHSLDLVSVIIPTYKRTATIIDTIESVLNQTYGNIEIIVVDDNGKGTPFQISTEELLSDYIKANKIIYIAHEFNRNGSVARNTGFAISNGTYINFLDDDDKLYPQKIEEQVKKLQKSMRSVGATYCNSTIIHKQNITNRLIIQNSNLNKEGNLCKEYILGQAKFNTSMIMFKRYAIEHIGGFDDSFIRHQDYELMIRFFRNFSIVCTSPYPLAVYDQTSDRINLPNCEKDYLMKQKLLNLFEADFVRYDAKDEIGHHLWLSCAYNAASSCNYNYLKKSLLLCKKYGKILFLEKLRIFRAIIVGILKNVNHG